MEDQPLIRPTGDYKKLICYQKAETIFDITYYFVQTYLRRGDRTIDQMQQAARSGKQNISEGYSRAGTSADTAIRLIDVAKSSLIELYDDYSDYLRTRGYRQWEENSKEWQTMRDLGRKYNHSAYYMELIVSRPPETIANMALILLKQTDYLLAKMLESLSKHFLQSGGFRERMTNMRLNHRKNRWKISPQNL
ncbi:MAG: four helix bundle suffix domain-containing protein [Dysgonamonadaceae bacterium]|jgi:four helix bundle suffix protein|nr:four helix bundle suffix domain-containing protein [Dysgonamonadaceae bacterium]